MKKWDYWGGFGRKVWRRFCCFSSKPLWQPTPPAPRPSILFSPRFFLSKFLSLFFNLLSKVAPVFDPKDKSLTLELLEISDLSAGGCRTPFYSVELWRVIQQPGISLPKDFGSTEYFGKDQHCENPNPDLLSRQDPQIISFCLLLLYNIIFWFCQLVLSDSIGCIYDLMISTVCL